MSVRVWANAADSQQVRRLPVSYSTPVFDGMAVERKRKRH
ncbi:hypothetical protein GFS60_06215 (plasmid) [Rhodococcus sp. WAY2]|nr:hypothetical protein GFS60_06215 [Rhodococcus sp. WAY2]